MTTAIDDAVETGVRFTHIDVTEIDESRTNPRKRFEDAGLEDLAESIRAVGVLEPLLLRPGQAGRWELVAGARRLRAARLADLATVPAIIRAMSDGEALEAQLVENLQRKDVHPLEEAEGFEALLAVRFYGPAGLAAKLGRPERFVRDRLRLLTLTPAVKAHLESDRISLGHAERIARLAPALQDEALEACFEEVFDYDAGDEQAKGEQRLLPLHRLSEWIDRHVRLDLAAPSVQEEFPELVAEVAKHQAAGATVLMLSDSYFRDGKPSPTEPLLRSCWNETTATGARAQLGVIVEGRRRGKTLYVEVIESHRSTPPSRTAPAPKTAAQKNAEAKARERDAKIRADAEAKAKRRARVEQLAVEALAEFRLQLTEAPCLRVVCEALIGAESFDNDTVVAAAKAIGVSREVFTFSGHKARLKLKAEQLLGVIAVLAIGASCFDDDKARADAFDAFGVDLKAIDKAVAAEQAKAPAPKQAKAPAPKPAKKARRK